MSEQVPVRFLRDFGRYSRGDMTSLSDAEVPRLMLKGVVALVARQAAVETATTSAPETAVTRGKR